MLELEREVEGEPIIFVAHGLGGILVKEGLHWSKSHISPRYQQLHQYTKHVIFLGVPHRGSKMANMGEILARLANASLQDTNKHLVSSLEVGNELLDRINFEFVKMVQLEDFGVYSFQESSGLSGLKGFSDKVVSDYSSKLDHPLEILETIRGNHTEIARFSDANDEGYRPLSKVIARCVTDSQRKAKSDEPSSLIKVYYNYHRVAEAPDEQPDYASLQVSQLLIEASRLAATEDIDGMLSVFLKIISIGDSSIEVCFVSLDYAIIMNKLRRPTETERVINQIFYSKRAAQPIDPTNLDRELARDLQSAYIWLKKTLSTCQRLQGHVGQSLQTLLTTLETTQAVFGVNSLSYFHAAFLLHRFYSCNYQQSSSTLESNHEEKKYSEMFVSALESLYCSSKSGSGGKQVCSVEGLQMGVILWAQGALEETVAVFEAFAELSGKIMGEDDVLSRKVRRAAAMAKEEWELGKKERREDVLKFGTVIFPRKMEDLALLLED